VLKGEFEMKIDDRVLNGPCVFCGYNGPGYWSAMTHDEHCPFYRVSGKARRKSAFKNAVRKQAILLEGFRAHAELLPSKFVGESR
jgi:hypothetical protein